MIVVNETRSDTTIAKYARKVGEVPILFLEQPNQCPFRSNEKCQISINQVSINGVGSEGVEYFCSSDFVLPIDCPFNKSDLYILKKEKNDKI